MKLKSLYRASSITCATMGLAMAVVKVSAVEYDCYDAPACTWGPGENCDEIYETGNATGKEFKSSLGPYCAKKTVNGVRTNCGSRITSFIIGTCE